MPRRFSYVKENFKHKCLSMTLELLTAAIALVFCRVKVTNFVMEIDAFLTKIRIELYKMHLTVKKS